MLTVGLAKPPPGVVGLVRAGEVAEGRELLLPLPLGMLRRGGLAA